jgi:hypothetical protein
MNNIFMSQLHALRAFCGVVAGNAGFLRAYIHNKFQRLILLGRSSINFLEPFTPTTLPDTT